MPSSSTLPAYPPLDTDTTTATAAPTAGSSSSPTAPLSHQSFFTQGGSSPPLIVGFVCMGAFILGVVSLCAWRRITGRPVWYAYSFAPRRYHAAGPQWHRERDGSVGGRRSSEKPAMFEAWAVRRTADALKWAESVPFAATLFMGVTDGECVVKVPTTPRIGDDGVEEEEEDEKVRAHENEKRGAREGVGGRLQVAVLLQMPSPNCAEKVSDVSLDRPVRGELVIGLMEVPWTREDRYSLKRTSSLL